MKSTLLAALVTSAALAPAAFAQATPPTVKIPETVHLPVLEPLVPACADPAADHFLEIDISQRAPAGATRVQRVSAWVTPDGVFHWPFVMRVRNIGDQPFIGIAGKQAAVVSEDDLLAKKKGKVLGSTKFDRIDAHSGVAVRFEFTATAQDMQKGKFHRKVTLTVDYGRGNDALASPRNGDCDPRNNSYSIEFNGSRKEWIVAK